MRLHPEGKYSASVHWPLLAAGLPLPALQVFKTFLLQNPPPTSVLLELTVDLWSCVCAHPSKPFQPLQVLERANVKMSKDLQWKNENLRVCSQNCFCLPVAPIKDPIFVHELSRVFHLRKLKSINQLVTIFTQPTPQGDKSWSKSLQLRAAQQKQTNSNSTSRRLDVWGCGYTCLYHKSAIMH